VTQPFLAFFIAAGIVLAAATPVIALLRARKIGDNPEFDQADINRLMNDKRGTPTMGGLLLIPAITAAMLIVDRSPATIAVALTMLCFCLLGVADDWFKLNKHRHARAGEKVDRQGLSSRAKLIVQYTLALGLALWLMRHLGGPATLRLPFPGRDVWLDLPAPAISLPLLIMMVVVGASNAVNLTDGMDGLSSGTMTIASAALGVVAWQQEQPQIAMLCAAIAGGCVGFLWFNANPARLFMGDTGSLALGAGLGVIAILLRQELLLVLIGGVFVAEALSVMLQVGYFKYTRKRTGTGRRIFLMSPLHHHFQKLGWPEPRIVTRFWVAGVMLAVAGLWLAA
jgi:phospho-N-acetylmuramoyl-pentapeptide-transferase